MSFRVYADNLIEYQACKRDAYIVLHGVQITGMEPLDTENSVDIFGDPNISNRKDKVFHILPLYQSYYQLLDVLGTDAENDLPLECIARVSDHIKRETIFRLPVRNGDGELIDRYWRVLSSEMKHTEVGYAKTLKCVPARSDCGEETC